MSAIIEELSSYLNSSEVLEVKVSNWSVGAHIEHCTKVIVGICTTLEQSNPDDYRKKFSLAQKIIFASGKIPRGKGKSPKRVVPDLTSSISQIQKYLEKAEEKLNAIESLPEKSHFNHPNFGSLDLKRAKKFIDIHTNHHIAIIKDIIKAHE